MKLKKKTATTYTNVVSLADAKAHLRVDTSTDDTLITSLINTAGEIVEQYTGVYLEQCDFVYYADTFQHIMNVHAGPGVRIDSVKYQSDAGTHQNMGQQQLLHRCGQLSHAGGFRAHPIRCG